MFDRVRFYFNLQDSSGYITSDELMTVLGGDEGARYSQEMWRTFLEEVDTDGDGKITLEEFKFMMKEVNSLTALTS